MLRHSRSQLAIAATLIGVAASVALGTTGSSALEREPSPLCERLTSAAAPAVVRQRRRALVASVWGGKGYRSDAPPAVRRVPTPQAFAGIRNLASVERMTFKLDARFLAHAFLLHAARRTRDTLVLYHEGHVDDFELGRTTIEFFLRRGFDVAALAMPLYSPNNRPHGWRRHEELAVLPHNGLPIFLEPAIGTLTELASKYRAVAMVGLSGGGWTTVMVSALDQRVTRSYQVSGSLPLCMRTGSGDARGDYEQVRPRVYERFGYLDLYVLGAESRRQVQIQIVDDVIFDGTISKGYEDAVNTAAALSGGSFQAVLDRTTGGLHVISRYALRWIARDMRDLP